MEHRHVVDTRQLAEALSTLSTSFGQVADALARIFGYHQRPPLAFMQLYTRQSARRRRRRKHRRP